MTYGVTYILIDYLRGNSSQYQPKTLSLYKYV